MLSCWINPKAALLDLETHPFMVQYDERVIHCSNYALAEDFIRGVREVRITSSATGNQIYPSSNWLQ